ncbi:hypothetical protein CAEBREN_16999 [Caenorhabditis brenneri]|uniref:RING-type domain-containing protein n=1 Tax=Caenorhabditis brenneri TaxID=135651 RepID=G0N819_CAEBE|nr:hypothetical protein CAEBREN_16999 [Caenorhabditis brenneri]
MEKRSQRRMVRIDEEQKVKTYLKFGFGATLIFSILPRITVFSAHDDYISIWVYTLVSLGSISIFFFVFIFPYRDWFHVFYHVCGSPTYVPLAFNFLLTTGLCRIGSTYPEEEHIQILFVQLFFTWISVVSSVELAHVITKHVYVRKPERLADFFATLGNAEMLHMEVVSCVKTIEYDDSKFNCKICTQAYDTETRIPLMLRNCGHSLCTACATTLLSENKKQYIMCPFCQHVTLVQGPAWFLPKNYTILEFLEDMPRDVVEQKEDEAVDVMEAAEAIEAVDAVGADENVGALEVVEAVKAEDEEEESGEEKSLVQQVWLS